MNNDFFEKQYFPSNFHYLALTLKTTLRIGKEGLVFWVRGIVFISKSQKWVYIKYLISVFIYCLLKVGNKLYKNTSRILWFNM